MMLGIMCKWECPSCGMLMRTASPFWNDKVRKNLDKPTKCGCGRASGFRLVDFGPCEFEVKTEENKGDE